MNQQNTQAQPAPVAGSSPSSQWTRIENDFQRLLGRTYSKKEERLLSSLSTVQRKVEDMLPESMKGHAQHLVKVAAYAYAKKPEWQDAETHSFVRCIIDAARFGLPVDGRVGHAIPRQIKVLDPKTGRSKKEKQLVFQPDYKGLVAVARRTETVKQGAGVICELVHKGDHFRRGVYAGDQVIEHEERFESGEVIGCFCVLRFPDDSWESHYLPIELVEKRHRSKSDSFRAGYGPWVDHPEAMIKKTLIITALKLHQNNEEVRALIEADETSDLVVEEEAPKKKRRKAKATTVEPEAQNVPTGSLHAQDPPIEEFPDHGETPTSTDQGNEIALKATALSEIHRLEGELDDEGVQTIKDTVDCSSFNMKTDLAVLDTAVAVAQELVRAKKGDGA